MTLFSEILLPVPPSANELWRPAGKRFIRTKKYEKWLEVAAFHFIELDDYSLPPKVPYEIRIQAAINRRRDLDNIIKPTLDLLQKVTAISDDRYVDHVYAWRDTEGILKHGQMLVTWQAADE